MYWLFRVLVPVVFANCAMEFYRRMVSRKDPDVTTVWGVITLLSFVPIAIIVIGGRDIGYVFHTGFVCAAIWLLTDPIAQFLKKRSDATSTSASSDCGNARVTDSPKKATKWAKKRLKRLLRLALPSDEWYEYRVALTKVVEEDLPRIIARRSALREDLDEVDALLKRWRAYNSEKSDDMVQELIEKTMRDNGVLQEMHEQAEEQYRSCIAFLDHIESDIMVARHRGKPAIDQLTTQLRKLSSEIEEAGKTAETIQRRVDEAMAEFSA